MTSWVQELTKSLIYVWDKKEKSKSTVKQGNVTRDEKFAEEETYDEGGNST